MTERAAILRGDALAVLKTLPATETWTQRWQGGIDARMGTREKAPTL